MALVAGEKTAEGRTLRECEHCHVVDDKGHHMATVPPTMTVISRHFKCCAENGCPDGSCAEILSRSPGV